MRYQHTSRTNNAGSYIVFKAIKLSRISVLQAAQYLRKKGFDLNTAYRILVMKRTRTNPIHRNHVKEMSRK